MTNRYTIIKTELDTDPLGRVYSGMSDVEAADDLNTEYRVVDNQRISNTQLYEGTDETEYGALDAVGKADYDLIMSLDGIDVTGGSRARTKLMALFPGGSTTRANLVPLLQIIVSRGVEIGVGEVSAADVGYARTL